jgi:hypothetical protein
MNKLITVLILFAFLPGCERNQDNLNSYLTAKIVGFDSNCSTCILEFPDDYPEVREVIGQSPDNYYLAVNLDKVNYEIGQQLKVKIRSPFTDELKPCIALYPSYNYKGVYVTESDNFDNLVLGDTISILWHDCLKGPENKMYICMESVINDSRCPTGAYCFWEGNATVRFKFEKVNEDPVLFDLNTHRGFTTDTVISGYKFSLVGLDPYPTLNRRIDPKDYRAQIVIEKE